MLIYFRVYPACGSLSFLKSMALLSLILDNFWQLFLQICLLFFLLLVSQLPIRLFDLSPKFSLSLFIFFSLYASVWVFQVFWFFLQLFNILISQFKTFFTCLLHFSFLPFPFSLSYSLISLWNYLPALASGLSFPRALFTC